MVITIVCAVCWTLVDICAKDKLYNSVESVPHNKVGLVLGTSPRTPSGDYNYYFEYRIRAAVALFKAGKVDYLLVSGDNRTKEYDEPTWMRDALVARGVPEDRIVLDFAGLRTLDSVVRAKEVFGQDTFTIISQQFHNERALYLADHYGINAVAFNAKDVKIASKWLKIHSRELLARVKLFVDLAVGKQTRHLGDKIKIG